MKLGRIQLLIATLVIVVGYLVWKSMYEPFTDVEKQQKEINQGEMPDPAQMMARVQGLLDKVSSPELMAHITTVMNKDPGELARMYANATSEKKTPLN